MARKAIPFKTKTRLWVLAGGRCQYDGCNKPLWRDELTMTAMNAAYIAHIVSDKPNGPRGNSVRSPQLARDIRNLMLMCDPHHRLIDVEDKAGHPESRLLKMKRRHEERIGLLTSIQGDKRRTIVTYTAPIGTVVPQIGFLEAAEAMAPDWYPAEDHAVDMTAKNTSFRDDEDDYWKIEAEHLRRQFRTKVAERIQSGSISQTSVFALAPQPLLIVLGALFTDLESVEVYQRHRESASWRWRVDSDELAFKVTRGRSRRGDVALNLSLSGKIDNRRITKVVGRDVPIWTVTVARPNSDLITSRERLQALRKCIRETLEEIKSTYGQSATLHVFPAMPNSTAVEFGRAWMPKAGIKLRLYDQHHRRDGFFDTGIELP